MKKINENTLRVILGAKDLEERGITMLDLLGNQGQIERFFHQILEEVDEEKMFAQSDAVTFQVMPNMNGLELLISKAGSPSEILQSTPKTLEKSLSRAEILQGLDDMSQKDGVSSSDEESDEPDLSRVYLFKDFDQLINLAKELKVTGISSSLRTYQGYYFLELAFLDENFTELMPDDAWVIANEFGVEVDEHYLQIRNQAKVLFEQDALENIRYYF